MLRDLHLERSYRSGRNDLLRDFYEPCLATATQYDRAVGYFTSTSLAAAARGLRSFLDHEGRMRLVVSPHLTHEDVAAIEDGYDQRSQVIERVLIRELEDSEGFPDPVSRRLEFLAWMVAEERLDIQVALVVHDGRVGIYHEKVGIFRDDVGDAVVFTGSANESVGGLLANFESLEVFCSWRTGDVERADRWAEDFEELWQGRTNGLAIHPFPEAVQERLLERYRSPNRPGPDLESTESIEAIEEGSTPFGSPSLPVGIRLREYQKDAVRAWLAANGQGIWAMATGTGKTVTALAAMSQICRLLQDRDRTLVAVVVCPFEHLVNQWAEACHSFGIRPIVCMGSRQSWLATLGDAFAGARAGGIPFVLAVCTNKTFGGDAFQARLDSLGGDLMIIADEVHNLGSRTLRRALPEQAKYRLGLSATPERHFDEEGTEALFEYFGPIAFRFGLRDAIDVGALVPYRYFPIQVQFTDEESDRYVDLTERIARAAGLQDLESDTPPGPLEFLLFERARLIGRASGKVSALAAVMTPLSETTHNLVYCAEGKDADDDLGQVDAVMRVLGRDLRMRVNSYTYETPVPQRQDLLHRFAGGELQALVAIRCLDEGMDIPDTRRGFILASTTNPRQFVQRRGRLLRPAPGKRRADLWDFFVVPPDLSRSPDLFRIERQLVGRELSRVMELAEVAENGPEASSALLELRRRYHLLDVGPTGEDENGDVS